MPKFNVEYDSNFDAQTALLNAAFHAAKLACSDNWEQLVNRVLAFLGFSPEEISAINIIHRGEVTLGDIMVLAHKRESKDSEKETPLMEIPDDKMKEILLTIHDRKLIKADNTWQFICYWLARHCKEWSGGTKSQKKRLQDLLGEDLTLPKRAFGTHIPSNLDAVLSDPLGKMGSYHYDAIMLLKALCEEENLHKGV